MIHHRLAGRLEAGGAVAFDEGAQALGADSARRDLGFHVADHEVRGPDVVAQHVPHRNHRPSLVVDLDRAELKPLRVGVDGVDDAAATGGEGADVEVVRGGDRVAGECIADEHRHDERDVGAVARPRVRVVVHDHVAGTKRFPALVQHPHHPSHVPGDRAGLERRRLGRLRQTPALRIDEAGPEILRFADDRGVRHPHQLVAHLDRDVLERTLDHARHDRIDLDVRPVRPPVVHV